MKKNILLALLIISLIVEGTLAGLCFFNPTKALQLFGLVFSDQTAFLGCIVAWFCLLVTLLIGYCFIHVKNNTSKVEVLINILCIWWIALGIGVFIKFGTIDNLLLDSAKGFILLIANYIYYKK